MPSRVLCSIRVKATPERAFQAFTSEMGVWWRASGLFSFTRKDAGPPTLAAELGGAVTVPLSDGQSFEVGRVLVWEPPHRLAFSWRAEGFAPLQVTEVQVTFEPVGNETRVSIEHRGWDAIPPENAARHGIPLGVFQLRLAEWWQRSLRSFAGRAALALSVSLAFSEIALAAERVVVDIPFASVAGSPLLLDLYLPPLPAKPVGLIVWVHGGAWRAGSRASVDLAEMTSRGWAIASVDYRLSPVAKFPAQVHDIKAAVRYLRAHAAEHGYPPSPFVIAGSSAGGHLAALVGVSNGNAELEGVVSLESTVSQSKAASPHAVSSDVQAIVSVYGASNLTSILSQSTPHGLNVRVPALTLLLGGQPDKVPDRARLASPVFHVDGTDPPLLLLHGDQDNQMPINQSHELEAAYAKHKRPVRFVVVHGAGHGGADFTAPAQLDGIDAFLRAQLAIH